MIFMDPGLILYPKALDWYQRIAAAFNFDQKSDELARDDLFQFAAQMDLDHVVSQLRDRFAAKIPLFFGAGPNLIDHIERTEPWRQEMENRIAIIAADGAAVGCRDRGIVPDLIVTDLDGLTAENFQYFLDHDTYFAVHGHGDNRTAIQSIRPLLQLAIQKQKIFFTTQVSPKFPVINPGGFTDGDRGPYLSQNLFSPSIPFLLLGYHFGEVIGPYSKPPFNTPLAMTPQKRLKLQFCRQLLADLHASSGRELILWGSDEYPDHLPIQSFLKR